jgi:sugar O-acyltransferase (sialic acid O-acetyltransferase NeuD family)
MIVIGAKGFAKEVLEVLHQLNQLENLAFYDDVNKDAPALLYGKFPILKSPEDAKKYFETIDNEFTLGIGNPLLRKKLYDKFQTLGGQLISTISPNTSIGNYDVEIALGANILPGAVLSNSVKIGLGAIVYYNAIITHDCVIGDFVEISPSANVLGGVFVDNYTQLGANCTVLPNIKIGKNVVVGAGSVVTKDVPDNCVAVGVPAKIIKERPKLNF